MFKTLIIKMFNELRGRIDELLLEHQQRENKTADINHMKKTVRALAGVAQWIECEPANQRVIGSIPSQGTCLGCGPGQVPSRECRRGNHTLIFLSLSFSLPSPLSKINVFLKRTSQK